MNDKYQILKSGYCWGGKRWGRGTLNSLKINYICSVCKSEAVMAKAWDVHYISPDYSHYIVILKTSNNSKHLWMIVRLEC